MTYTKSLGLDLTVVVFPHLRDVRGSAVITSQVADYFQKHAVRVVNLEPLLEDRDLMSMVVNSLDAHPNEALNKEVAELLTKAIQSAGNQDVPAQ